MVCCGVGWWVGWLGALRRAGWGVATWLLVAGAGLRGGRGDLAGSAGGGWVRRARAAWRGGGVGR